MTWRALGISVAAAFLAVGCGQPRPGAVALNGAGATFPYPLYSKWFDAYTKVAPRVRINYQSIGSGGGIQQLKAGTVDFGASDAPLSDAEAKGMPDAVVHIPTAAGAVAIVYNLPGLARPLQLDGATLSGIFLGEITRWNDSRLAALNPGLNLPDMAITVTHRSDGSGTTYIFTHYLAAVSARWADKVGAAKSVEWPAGVGGKGNEGVTGLVKQTPGGIGYVEMAYAVQSKLPYARLRNRAGQFVEATIASTTAAGAGAIEEMRKDLRVSIVDSPAKDAYPIAGFTYLLVYRDQKDRAKGEALTKFLEWAIHDGQRFAAPLDYAPLPAAVVAINEAALRSLQLPAAAAR